MKCSDPVLCYTSHKKRFYRHFSLASDIIKRIHQQVFSCGKCLFCRKKKAYELASRCVLHASLYTHNSFLTLTYDETMPGYHNNFNYRDIQLFKKKLRQHCWRNHEKKIEIFNVHEYGKNGKKHWHLILFNHDFSTEIDPDTKKLDRRIHTIRNGIPLYTSPTLDRIWGHGITSIGDVSEASAMYQAQYTQKDFQHGNVSNSRKSHSKHAGLGRPYFLHHYEQILMLGYVPFDGKKMPLPRYFEKLAKKHWAHFYEPTLFFDTFERKREFTPFRNEEPSKRIADLYTVYKKQKNEKIVELEKEWEKTISTYFIEKEKPDFQKSGENVLYDLQNRKKLERF